MNSKKLSIAVNQDESVSAILTLPDDKEKISTTGVITAHGAGNDMNNDLLIAFTEGLAKAGYPTLRFNFPYKEKGRKAPDKQELLEETWSAIFRYFKQSLGLDINKVIAAGKSMGGRVASQMAGVKKLSVDGLIFLGYPLHPAGDLTKIRDAHLYQIDIPMLFFAGTRDSLCDLGKLRSVLKKLSAPWKLEIIDGGDHSFHVPKSMNMTASNVHDHIVKTALHWIDATLNNP